MVTSRLKQLGKRGIWAIAIVGLVACVKAASNSVRVADAVVDQPEMDATANASEFAVCSDVPNWQRPSSEQQQKQLADDERYGSLLQDKDFQQFADQFWQHDILSFTTYGLSARMEPVNLSGLWAVADEVWANCYGQGEGTAINEGTLAEAWLMHHQVVDVQWQDDHYVMVVEPASQGMQVVQFARRETAADLPLSIVTTNGNVVEYHNADW